MIKLLKRAVKSNSLTRGLAKRVRDFFFPHRRLQDLLAAWNMEFYANGDRLRTFELYRENRAYQANLVSQAYGSGPPAVKYLGPEWLLNIGTLAHLDSYFKIGLLGWRPPQQTILAAYPGLVGNRYFLDLWKDYCTILDESATLRRLERDIMLLAEYHLVVDVSKTTHLFPNAAAIVQKEWERQSRQPLLQLPTAAVDRGWTALAHLGLQPGDWFVAMHVREDGYKPGAVSVRNAKIETYFPAMNAIVQAGGWVIRCGDPSMSRLPTMPRVIDYAHSPLRADWLDIFLASQCRFFIGTQSGISHVPDVFGVPSLCTNWASWGFPPWYGTIVFIPKLMRCRKRARLLCLHELVREGSGFWQSTALFDAADIQILDNTPELIKEGVDQLLAETTCRYNPLPQTTIAKAFEALGLTLNGRVSTSFLAQHESLLTEAVGALSLGATSRISH